METGDDGFFIISHRGASAYKPENTLSSFRTAIEMGAGLIELDVRKTLDNRLVVMHDSKIDRTTNGSGHVRDKTFEELRTYDAGNGEKIPELGEVLSLGKGKTRFVIEVKEEKTEDEIILAVKEHGLTEDVFLVSFKKKVIKYIKTLEPGIMTGLITILPLKVVSKGIECHADAVAVGKYFINEKLIREAHNNGLYIFAWTVDDTKRCLRLREMGVDGVVTNKPDILDMVVT